MLAWNYGRGSRASPVIQIATVCACLLSYHLVAAVAWRWIVVLGGVVGFIVNVDSFQIVVVAQVFSRQCQ